MVTIGFVVKDWFNRRLASGKCTADAKQMVRTYGDVTFPVKIGV